MSPILPKFSSNGAPIKGPSRTVLTAIVLILPILLLGGLARLQNSSEPPAPQWIIPFTGVMETCGRAAFWDQLKVEAAAADVRAEFPEDSAMTVGKAIIKHYYDFHGATGSEYVAQLPILVNATFPDDQRRLAWVFGWQVSADPNFMTSQAALIYLDAADGKPLLLLTDIVAQDPTFTCAPIHIEVDSASFTSPLLSPNVLAALIGIYILGIAVFFGVRWRRQRRN